MPTGVNICSYQNLHDRASLQRLAVAQAEEVEVVAGMIGRAARFQRLADEPVHHADGMRLEPQNLLHRAALRVA